MNQTFGLEAGASNKIPSRGVTEDVGNDKDFQSTGPRAREFPRVAVATQHGCAGLRQPPKWGVADATHGAYRRWVHGLKSMATIGCRYRDTAIHALRVAASGGPRG
ncbi:MAG: hypothetical protein ACREIC_27415, partial [Limisphaerales bacterium]